MRRRSGGGDSWVWSGSEPSRHCADRHNRCATKAIAIDTAKTALIVVDMQNDFGTKGGMFDREWIEGSNRGRDLGLIFGPGGRELAHLAQRVRDRR